MLKFREFINMTNLISREAAISLLKDQFYEQCPKGSVQRILFANAIEALTNMPSAEQPPKRDDWVMIP